MSNLEYIDELGIGIDQTESDTEAEVNNTEESNEDLSLDSEEKPSENTETETEGSSELDSLKQQIAGMEKRIADKDEFITELREASKQREAEQQVDTSDETKEDFWDNPEGTIKNLQDTIRLQQMQIQETVYANTVDGYWKTVNPDALKEAVATDTEFANKFNSSNEPYKTAYEYLMTKADTKVKADNSLREQIKQELLKEMGVKENKEVPPTINSNGGKSTSGGSKAPEDGFAQVFGSQY